ncbi:RNA recognition motif domain containing protein [Entamoeba marina]
MLPQKEKPFDSNTSVFVGRLPKVMDEQQVKDSFVSCGPIQRILMQKYPDGKSKGSCFIEFESNAAATKACARDGSVIHSQHIHVNMAEKKPKKNKYKHLPTNQQKKIK